MIVSAIIPVAGRGKRFGGQIPKQYLEIDGIPVIVLTLQKFLGIEAIKHIVVVTAKEDIKRTTQLLNSIPGLPEKLLVVRGGQERQDSVYQGLLHTPPTTDIVIVHDGVRPLVTEEIIKATVDMALRCGACVVAVPVKETIKRVKDKTILETIPRESLWQVQTPQTFKYAILKQAHERARSANFYSTDESALVEWSGHTVKMITGDYCNIKITTPEDLQIARQFYREKAK
jgi:2-C-methyl-D-erythritol 4-phosphate cytidylyltransferase